MATHISPITIPVAPLVLSDKHGVPCIVREYQAGDRQALQEFYESFEPKRIAQGLPPADPDRIASWLSSIIATGIHLLAFRDDRLIGHALVMPTAHDGIGEYAVFLHQDFRGVGIGTELARVIVEVSAAKGLHGLWLTVEPRNRAAIRTYEKAGFHFIPETVYSVEAEMELQIPNNG